MAAAPLLPVSHAQTRLLALATPVSVQTVPLRAAAGRWAASAITALRTQPELPLSAMDGYAIRFADLPGPWQVIGESAAGRPFAGSIAAHQAVRIFTGAAVPPGADTILVQEEALCEAALLVLNGAGPDRAGRHIRAAGLDFGKGDVLVRPGERLGAAQLALAAIAGHGKVAARRPVRVAIAATGDELRPPGSPLDTGQLPESNGVMLAALIADLPVDILDLGILPDRRDALQDAFARVEADILVTTGGASVGDHDLVRPALEAVGARIDFWKIAMRPGKPVMAGRLGDTVVLGLPGNPVSAFVTALLFLRPLIAHMAGDTDPLPRPVAATLATDLPVTGPRAVYLRASRRDGGVHMMAMQDSSMLRALAGADCLIVRPAHAPAARAGETVDILELP